MMSWVVRTGIAAAAVLALVLAGAACLGDGEAAPEPKAAAAPEERARRYATAAAANEDARKARASQLELLKMAHERRQLIFYDQDLILPMFLNPTSIEGCLELAASIGDARRRGVTDAQIIRKWQTMWDNDAAGVQTSKHQMFKSALEWMQSTCGIYWME